MVLLPVSIQPTLLKIRLLTLLTLVFSPHLISLTLPHLPHAIRHLSLLLFLTLSLPYLLHGPPPSTLLLSLLSFTIEQPFVNSSPLKSRSTHQLNSLSLITFLTAQLIVLEQCLKNRLTFFSALTFLIAFIGHFIKLFALIRQISSWVINVT